jgi:glycosyltransferase involved in cell wall biosynthesis
VHLDNMLENKKILLVVGSLNQGGAEFQLLSLARLLQSRGWDVEVFALTDYDYFLPFIKKYQIHYSCVENKGSNIFRVKKAVAAIKSKKPGLVISYIKKVSQVAMLAKIYSGFKFKLIISERTSLVRPWHDLFYFNLANIADKITVNSIPKLHYINRKFFLLRNKTVFMPNIIDLDKFLNVQRKKSDDGVIHISYVGRISPEKNLVNLIKAIADVSAKRENIRLTLYGAANSKAYMESLVTLVAELKLEKIVSFSGPVKEVTGIYSNTDLLCLVSIFEGFSNVLSEAISCGIPVVASNIEENRFLVEDGVNGFLAEPADYKSIARAIDKFLSLSTEEIQVMNNENKQKAIAVFNEEKIYQRYLDIFSETGFLKPGIQAKQLIL